MINHYKLLNCTSIKIIFPLLVILPNQGLKTFIASTILTICKNFVIKFRGTII